jgi:hypothetical protein
MNIDWFGQAGPWPTMLFPAMLTAVLVRWDAVRVGPYFALSDLISAMPPSNARAFYEDNVLRRALYRRFLYPALMGIAVSWIWDPPLSEVAIAGVLCAVLLIWPVLFQGLAWYVPQRGWYLPALYGTFVAAYGSLAAGGGLFRQFMLYVADGDLGDWIADQLAASVLVWIVALFAAGLFRSVDRATTAESNRRERLGGERLSGHDPGDE